VDLSVSVSTVSVACVGKISYPEKSDTNNNINLTRVFKGFDVT
jgi:hypothetical protein